MKSPHGIQTTAAIVFVLSIANGLSAQDASKERLTYVESTEREDLDAVTSVVISSDGRFLYTSAYQAASHVVFARDMKSGELSHVQTVFERDLSQGATSLRLSKDNRFAVTAAFRSQAVTLYSRNEETGRLEYLDSKQQDADEGVTGLEWAVDARFTPDGKFIYAIDDRGSVTSFQVVQDDKKTRLKFVEAFRDEQLKGARGLAIHPTGGFLFVACKTANTLVTLRRDAESGKVSIADVRQDDVDGVTGLLSAFGVTTSDDGQYVYAVSGQHGPGKDNCLGVYRFDSEKGTLACRQEVFPGEVELDGKKAAFVGGNVVSLDPAQTRVFASATASGGLAMFDRDVATGEISLVQLVDDNERLGWLSGLAVSPDNRFVYGAAERLDSVVMFRLAP